MRDLIPFLALFIVTVSGFAMLQWIVVYKSTGSEDSIINISTLMHAMRMTYFQIFGEYNLEKLMGEGNINIFNHILIICTFNFF